MNRSRNSKFSRASSDVPFDNYRRQNFWNQQNSNSFDNEDYSQQSYNQFNNFPGPFNSFDGPPSGFGNYNGNNFNSGSFPNMRYQNFNMRNGPFGNNFGGMNQSFNNTNQFPNMRYMGGRNMYLNKANSPFKNQNYKNMKKKNFNIPNTEFQTSKNVLQALKLNKKKKPIMKKSFANGNTENNILTADKEPTNKMKGRMEFVMGNIIREFKKHHNDPTINNCLEIPFIQRVVKDIIRQRIVNVMMNKKIDNYTDTIDAYCKNYPYATDEEILKEVKADIYEGEHKFDIDTDEPKKFFRYNLLRLVDTRVDEMLDQLSLKFGNNEDEILSLIDTLPDIETNENGENNESDDVVLVPDESNAEAKKEVDNNEMSDEEKKKAEKLKIYMHVTDLLLKERLPKILTDCKHKIIKVISGKDFKALQEQILLETKSLIAKNHQKLMENLKEEQNQNSESTPPYYVMVHGEPKLPTKDEFRDFIKQYNPKFVKKHRTNDNLVVVTFDKIEDYNKLLGKKHIVGGITLILKPTTQEHALSELENQTCAENVEENCEEHEEMDTGELEL